MFVPTLFVLALAGPADLVALGVVVSAQRERSTAILKAAGKTRLVETGDNAFGGRVTAIDRAGVSMQFGDERVEVRLARDRGSANATIRSDSAGRTREETAAPAATPKTFARQDLTLRLGKELPRILAETTIVPMTDGGKVGGFTLTRIPEGSLLADAGLQVGDVLTRVNDVPIDSLSTLISLWPRLQGETEIRADILRNGSPLSLKVTLH